MKSTLRLFAIAAIFSGAAFFASHAIAQGVAAGPAAAAATNTQDICVTNPNAKLTPAVKPHKKFAHIKRTGPVAARATRLAHARRKKPAATQVQTASICPVGQKIIRVSTVTPIAPVPQYSLCQSALGASANVTAAQASAMLTAAGLENADITHADNEALAAAVTKAIQANPSAAPAILAYVIHGLNPNNKEALAAVTKAAYTAAPNQAAGLTYAAISTNPGQTMPITQALLASAPEADGSIIRQCAIDANPDLANQIATAAFVPALAEPTNTIGANDIRNNINNATGTVTLVPGLPAREPDNSPT